MSDSKVTWGLVLLARLSRQKPFSILQILASEEPTWGTHQPNYCLHVYVWDQQSNFLSKLIYFCGMAWETNSGSWKIGKNILARLKSPDPPPPRKPNGRSLNIPILFPVMFCLLHISYDRGGKDKLNLNNWIFINYNIQFVIGIVSQIMRIQIINLC